MFTIEEPAYFNKNKVLRILLFICNILTAVNLIQHIDMYLVIHGRRAKKPKYRHMAKFLVTNILR